ncbi:MAG TPA: hypothetical protein VFO60_02690 [Candidatus Dormibacteraeota bacterium]|nr:hypothetical protein [Candidatus Dormibacteraeota bacterium]
MLTSVDVRTGLAFTPIGMLLGLRDELAEHIDENHAPAAFREDGGIGAAIRLATVDDEIERRAAAYIHVTAGGASAGWQGGWRGPVGEWRRRRGVLAAEITGFRAAGMLRLRSVMTAPRSRPDLARGVRMVAETSAAFWRARVAVAEAQARVDHAIDGLAAAFAAPETVDAVSAADLDRLFTLTVRPVRSRAHDRAGGPTAVPTLVLGRDGEAVWPLDPRRQPDDTPAELRPQPGGGVPALLFAGAARRRELIGWCVEDLRRGLPVS